ncbi:MAG: hypothetical protein ACRCUH_08870 [Shewanella sp.]
MRSIENDQEKQLAHLRAKLDEAMAQCLEGKDTSREMRKFSEQIEVLEASQ